MASPPDRFGQLRSILQQTPSTQVWAALCAELALWHSEALEREALPYAASILERWPAEIERWQSDGEHHRWLEDGVLTPGSQLANAMMVRSPEQLAELLGRGYGPGMKTLFIIGACTTKIGARYAPLVNVLSLERLVLRMTEAHERSDPTKLIEALTQPTLRRLTVHTNGMLGDRCAECIAQNGSLAGVEALDLGGHFIPATLYSPTSQVGPQGLAALASASIWENLHTLALGHCPIGAAGIQLIARRVSPWRALGFVGAGLDDEDVRHLVASPAMRGLQRLDLSDNQLTDQAPLALASSPHLSALRVLDLDGNALTTDGAASLVEHPSMPALESLGLRCEQIEGSIVQRADPSILHALRVYRWRIDASLAERLAARWPPALKMPDLDRAELLEGAGLYVARWPQLAQLTHLTVDGQSTGAGDWQPILSSAHLTGLRSLTLKAQADDAMVCAVAQNPHLGQLVELTLGSAGITSRGVAALMASPHPAQLRTLSIHGELDMAVARCIAQRTGLPGLRELRFGGAHQDVAFVEALCAGEGLCGVESLGLGSVDDALVRALVSTPFVGALCSVDRETGLHTLSLPPGDLSSAGLALLLGHPEMAGLEALRAVRNPLGDAVFKVLDDCPNLGRLRALTLHFAQLTPIFTRRLARAAWVGQLTHLDLSYNSRDPAFAAPFAGTSHATANPGIWSRKE
jgi:hypothetical protein